VATLNWGSLPIKGVPREALVGIFLGVFCASNYTGIIEIPARSRVCSAVASIVVVSVL
jgi:hypothetical protein